MCGVSECVILRYIIYSMYTQYCFSRSNFLVELVAGLGGALLCGVPGVIVGSFYGSVYPEIVWGGLRGEPAAGMLGLLFASTVGGWLMVYGVGQLIHDHRSGLVSWCGAVLGMIAAIYVFDYSYQPWFTTVVLVLPVLGAAFGYNLPVPRNIHVSAPAAVLLPPVSPRALALDDSKPRRAPRKRTKKAAV